MAVMYRHFQDVLAQGLTYTQSMKLTMIASPIYVVFILLMVTTTELVEAGMFLPGTKAEAKVESPKISPLDRKSFKTVPFEPTPSDTQRRELEQAVASCIKTVEQQVPGAQFEASPDGGIVNTAGNDRERFTFWKCMSESGHPLAPIRK
jgi:hypothetical protein